VEDAADLVRGHAVDDPWATDILEQDEADAVMELLVHLERVEDVSGRRQRPGRVEAQGR
jgi:hypothetical protein